MLIILSNIKTFWFSLSDKIRFVLIGGFNALVSYAIFSTFCLVFGDKIYQIALALSWFLSSTVSFFTQKYLVFNVEGNFIKQYCKCLTTWVFSYLINAIVLELLVKKLCLNVYLGQFIATFTCAIFTYILFKKFAFCKKYEN